MNRIGTPIILLNRGRIPDARGKTVKSLVFSREFIADSIAGIV